MPRIKTKNSTTSTAVPTNGSLLQGELAVNIADKKLYIGNSGGSPIEITSQGVTDVSIGASGLYATQATGSIGLGLAANVLVSGSLHVSGVLTQSPAAINIFASEDPLTGESRMINMRSYAGGYSEINVADDGTLVLKSDGNTVSINSTGTGTEAVYLNSTSSTGYLYTTPTDIRIGGASATTTFSGDVAISKTLTVEHINGDLDGAVLKVCKNTDSVALRKGDPVYIAGTVGATNTIEVQLATSNTAAKMPAVGLAYQSLAVNATGHIIVLGTLSDVDTSAFTVGQSVYVNSTGWLTSVRPTGASILVQNIGRVGRVNANNGQIIVLGPGRTNDVPNNILASGTLTLGTPDIITPLVGTATVFNTNVSRVNIGTSASGVQIGHATGVVTVGDIAVNDGTISTTASTATIFDANATTITIGSAATTTNIAAIAGTNTVNIGAATNSAGTTKTINIGTGGSAGSTSNVNIGSVQTSTLAINSSAVVGASTTQNLFNNGSTIVANIFGFATGIFMGATGSTLTLRGGINATGSIFNNGTISTTGHITAASGYRVTSSAINAQTATGYTLQASDNGRIITFDSAATHTLRIPTGLDIGFNATVIQLGTGQITCTGLSGATVNCYASGNKTLGQHASASIICYASNTYNLGGTLGI